MPRSGRSLAVGASTLALLTATGAFATSAEAKTRKLTCDAGVQWTNSTSGFVGTFTDVTDNYTRLQQQKTFTTSTSGTVSVTRSAGVEAGISGGFPGLQASVKVQLNQSVTEQVTIARGQSDTINVPPRKRIVYKFGARVLKLRGQWLADPNAALFPELLKPVKGLPPNCFLKTYGPVTAKVPVRQASQIIPKRLPKRS